MVSISVVIPVYNGDQTLARAIDSVLSQTIRPDQIIVVDDGSDDNSRRVSGNYPEVTLVCARHGGLGWARNQGLKAATSEWVALLDCDDEWLPSHLATLRSAVRPGDVLVGSNARGIPSGRLVGHPEESPLELDSLRMIWPESPVAPSATMVNRATALRLGGFSTRRLGEDREMFCKLLEHGGGRVMPEVTCLYHEHSAQMSSARAQMRLERQKLLVDLSDCEWLPMKVIDYVHAVATWDQFRASPTLRAGYALIRAGLTVRGIVALAAIRRYRRSLALRNAG